jgi:hypothetical protein
MAEMPEWVSLLNALMHAKRAGFSDGEAKRLLCQAMSDYSVAFRFAPIDIRHKGIRGMHIIPNALASGLGPDDFDWANSRPLNSPTPMMIASPTEAPENLVVLELDFLGVIELLGGSGSEYTVQKETLSSTIETKAANALASRLKNDGDNIKVKDAFEWCTETGFNLTWRAFHYRVWPKARKKAGLSEKAPPGPKRKSSH